jgi:putative ABC transport system permease protein
MNILLRFALWLCPAEYAREYHDEIRHDIDSRRLNPAAVAADLAFQGIFLRSERIARDVAIATRALARAPLYTVVATATIAIAIGANVAVASVLGAVVLNPLPFADSNRIVMFGPLTEGLAGISTMPYLDTERVAQLSTTLTTVSAYQNDVTTLIGFGRPVALRGLNVSANYFQLLGVQPMLGRLLDETDGGSARVVLSERLWRQYLGADPAILGKRVRLGDRTYTVTAVVSADFRDPAPGNLAPSDYWLAVDPHSSIATAPSRYAFFAFARLRPQATIEAARADMRRAMAQIVRESPDAHRGVNSADASTLPELLLGPTASLLWFLYAGVIIVMLIACANVVNLSFVRTAGRAGDYSVASALGASRKHLIAQTTTEAAVLSTVGGLAGMGLAIAGLRLLAPVTTILPRGTQIVIDWHVLAYTSLTVIAVTVLTGLLPALFYRANPAAALKRSGRGKDHSATKNVRAALIVLEVGLALTVAISAGLLLRSFVALVHTNTGLTARNVFEFPIGSFSNRYANDAERVELEKRIEAALRRIPGVTSVAAASRVPFVNNSLTSVLIPAQPGRSAIRTTAPNNEIGADYFQTFGIPLQYGRPFTLTDRASSTPVLIVSETFARKYFGTTRVTGRRIATGFIANGQEILRTIVGVAADTRNSYSVPPAPDFYMPVTQNPRLGRFLVKTSGSPAKLASQITNAIQAVDPQIAPGELRAMPEMLAQNGLRSQAATTLFSLLATIAVLLAIAGIYAVTASSVEQRTREFGIRKAVGAGSWHVLRDVLGSALVQTSIGVGLGLAAAAALAPVMASLLFATSPLDPLTYAAVIVLLQICTAIAAIVPAIRAVRIPPAQALRYE